MILNFNDRRSRTFWGWVGGGGGVELWMGVGVGWGGCVCGGSDFFALRPRQNACRQLRMNRVLKVYLKNRSAMSRLVASIVECITAVSPLLITSLTIVCSPVYSGADKRKHQSSTSLAFFAGNSPMTGAIPAQRASNAENVSIWWRYHATIIMKLSCLNACRISGAL